MIGDSRQNVNNAEEAASGSNNTTTTTTNNNNDGLVEALPVTDDPILPMAAGPAQPVNMEQPLAESKQDDGTNSMKCGKQKVLVGMCLLISIVIVVVIILGSTVGFTGNNNNSNSNNQESPLSPTTTSSPSPTAWTDMGFAIFGFPIRLFILYVREEPDSTQSKAYHWMKRDPNLAEYSSHCLLQRFVMVRFYVLQHSRCKIGLIREVVVELCGI